MIVGTGKSFLLTTVYLWCIVHGLSCKAAAPTGIAAANIEVEGTDVFASTLHNVFDLDSAYNSNLDFTKTGAGLSWAGDTRSVSEPVHAFSLHTCARAPRAHGAHAVCVLVRTRAHKQAKARRRFAIS